MSGPNLYEYFYEIATRNLEQIAIEFPGAQVSYGELLGAVCAATARLDAGLDARLDEAGVTRPRRVGLLASRSLAAYAGYLAILRRGAAVVAMNVHSNLGRNVAIAQEADLDAIVVDESASHTSSSIAEKIGAPLIDLSGLRGESHAAPGCASQDSDTAARADDTAYIGFTSGSTGRPKGVQVSHGNAVSFISFAVGRYGFDRSSRVGQVFELSFDPAIMEVFCAWAGGGTLCVVPHEDVLFPDSFANELRLTHILALPSMVSFALREGQLSPGRLPLARHILLGGEPLSQSHAAAMSLAAPGATIYNCYGPTELTVLCGGYTLGADRASWSPTSNGTIPIGAIYPHLEYRIVDEGLRITDDGEMCVRGPQRFAGYLDPAHNAGRFVRIEGDTGVLWDGGSPVAVDGWYRTGDRVRSEGGLLVHLGRMDTQVKINGFRVELGEIEAVVRAHPQVIEAIAVIAEDDDLGKLVHAFYTGSPVRSQDLAGLVADLPPHMRPVEYHYREQIPLTLNGKADRQRLIAELAATSAVPTS